MKFIIAIFLVQVVWVNFGACTFCQNVPVLSNYKPNDTLGSWYIAAREVDISSVMTCPGAIYTFLTNTEFHGELNGILVQTNAFVAYNEQVFFVGNATDGKVLTITTDPISQGVCQVLDFSANHILAYQCDEENKMESLYVLTRSKRIRPRFLEKLKKKLAAKGIRGLTLVATVLNC